jgi:hypothetical protein
MDVSVMCPNLRTADYMQNSGDVHMDDRADLPPNVVEFPRRPANAPHSSVGMTEANSGTERLDQSEGDKKGWRLEHWLIALIVALSWIFAALALWS